MISVIRQNRKTYELVEQVRVGNVPRGCVKVTQHGHAFASNTSGNTISELDVFTYKEVGHIIIGHGPRGIGIVPEGSICFFKILIQIPYLC